MNHSKFYEREVIDIWTMLHEIDENYSTIWIKYYLFIKNINFHKCLYPHQKVLNIYDSITNAMNLYQIEKWYWQSPVEIEPHIPMWVKLRACIHNKTICPDYITSTINIHKRQRELLNRRDWVMVNRLFKRSKYLL